MRTTRPVKKYLRIAECSCAELDINKNLNKMKDVYTHMSTVLYDRHKLQEPIMIRFIVNLIEGF